MKAAEAKLSKDQLALFASFEGMVKVGADEQGAHSKYPMPAGHKHGAH